MKDLSLISNRDLSQIIIVDNSPMSYLFHPENAIDCSSFIDNQTDVEMWYIADFLISISKCDDVRQHCRLIFISLFIVNVYRHLWISA